MTQTNRRGSLIVVSGFSGAGKGTLMKELISRYEGYALSISMTTRAPRPGEADGKDYFFVTTEQFEHEIATGGLLEYAHYVDHYYGTPRKYVEQQIESGKDVILEIEYQGASQIRKAIPETVLVFVVTPTAAELERRLTERATETENTVAKRLRQATREIQEIPNYDYVVVNDDLDECVETLHTVIQTSHYSPVHAEEMLKTFSQDLNRILEKHTGKP